MNLSLYPHGTGRRIGCRCRVLDRRTFTATFIGCLSCILAGMKRALRAKVDRDKGGDKGTGGTKSPPATTSFLCLHSFAKPGDATVPERDCARRVSRRKLARSEDARTVLNRSTVRTLLRLVCDTAAVRGEPRGSRWCPCACVERRRSSSPRIPRQNFAVNQIVRGGDWKAGTDST
jgi:hypothetical protein